VKENPNKQNKTPIHQKIIKEIKEKAKTNKKTKNNNKNKNIRPKK